ncbi:hypothetical protein BC832DRAFT_33082 [Gaertneriomyces semiglobifer]|nr:hypothetical protein BC832DRAFT_33082 [Gaertneriomyces semiglobifer]
MNMLTMLAAVAKAAPVSEGYLDFARGANKSHNGFFVHQPYYDRYDYAKSQWIAVTALLFTLGLVMLARELASYFENAGLSTEEELDERRALLDNDQRPRAVNSWTSRCARGAGALRHALLMLLGAVVFTTLPYPYACRSTPENIPGIPIPPSPQCGTCLGSGTTLGTSVLSWVFFSLAILWLLLEMVASENVSAALMRSIIGILSYPLIFAIFINGFVEWTKMKSHEDHCSPQNFIGIT